MSRNSKSGPSQPPSVTLYFQYGSEVAAGWTITNSHGSNQRKTNRLGQVLNPPPWWTEDGAVLHAFKDGMGHELKVELLNGVPKVLVIPVAPPQVSAVKGDGGVPWLFRHLRSWCSHVLQHAVVLGLMAAVGTLATMLYLFIIK